MRFLSHRSMPKNRNDIQVRNLTPEEAPGGGAVLGRGMRDNPLHLSAFGPDPARRERALTLMFCEVMKMQISIHAVLGAFRGTELVGVCGLVPPGHCQAGPVEKARFAPILIRGGGISATLRIMKWLKDWGRNDPKTIHWHLGPVGVDRHLQGQGIGSALLQEFCRLVDSAGNEAYLETDKRENVPFYERFGFKTTNEHDVLGVRNWFMIRVSQKSHTLSLGV